MSDNQIVEVMSKALALYYEYECAADNPAVQAVLAALRSEGWELYRPEDVRTFRICVDHVAMADRGADTCEWYWDEDGHRCNVGTYRLVPVEPEEA